jgi:hypothetical protein
MWSRVLAFLRDEGNRGILTFLGGGAVVVGGLWTAFTFFAEKPGEKPSSPPSSTSIVEQKGTGFATGHDINIQAPVTINPDAREVAQQVAAPINEQLQKLVTQVARDKSVEVAPLLAVLVKLGEAGVPAEDIPKRLDAKADELLKLRAEIKELLTSTFRTRAGQVPGYLKYRTFLAQTDASESRQQQRSRGKPLAVPLEIGWTTTA